MLGRFMIISPLITMPWINATVHEANVKEEDYIIFSPFNLPLLFQRKKVTTELNALSIIRITMSLFLLL